MIKKRIGLSLAMVSMLALAACGSDNANSLEGGDSTKESKKAELVIAEPVHSFSYLPLYVAINKGFFKDAKVSVTTLTGGSAHTNAVLTGKAWAFIGGPEHNAFAKAKGADLRAIANVVNKGNVYLVARPELTPGKDMAAFVKGKTIVTGQYGSTPSSITRYLLAQWGLDPKKDVKLMEVENAAIPTILSEGKGDIAVVSDPTMQQGINEGIWKQPFYNVPKELGPYAYSTINVQLDTIKNHSDQADQFVQGMKKGLELIKDDPEEALAIAKKEFPTLDEDILASMMDRSIADGLWEFSGKITEESVTTNLKVVKNAGMLKEDIKYEDVIDPQFFE